jgi:C-terminal processing protease CtpA/Prc
MQHIKFAENTGGLPVQAVAPNGIADRAGLRPWDVIIAINSVDVRGYGGQQTIDVIKQLPPSACLELLVIRSNNPPAPVVVKKIPSFAEILCCGGGN